MSEKSLKVNINSLIKVSNEIKSHHTIIMENFDNFLNEFENLGDSYDTNTASIYLNLMEKGLSYTKAYIDENNKYIMDKLNEISNKYKELYDEVHGTINGGDGGSD